MEVNKKSMLTRGAVVGSRGEASERRANSVYQRLRREVTALGDAATEAKLRSLVSTIGNGDGVLYDHKV